MKNDKFELHPDLKDASLEAACEMADRLTRANLKFLGASVAEQAIDLHYMLEYLRLNFDLVPKK